MGLRCDGANAFVERLHGGCEDRCSVDAAVQPSPALMLVNDKAHCRQQARALYEEGIMSLNDYIGPAITAAIFTVGGYAILNANLKYADDIGQMLWTLMCISAALAMVAVLAQIPPRGAHDARVVVQKATDHPHVAITRGGPD
jgi:hypothetical protein